MLSSVICADGESEVAVNPTRQMLSFLSLSFFFSLIANLQGYPDLGWCLMFYTSMCCLTMRDS